MKYEQSAFCKEGALWFKRYIEFLQISIFYDLWYIPVESIEIPMDYEIIEPSVKNRNRIMQGGKRNCTKKSAHSGIMSFREEDGLGLSWKDI